MGLLRYPLFAKIVEIVQSDPTKLHMTAEQPDGTKLNVTIEGWDAPGIYNNSPHYKDLPHDTPVEVWKPETGYKTHPISMVVSVSAAGTMTIYDRTPPSTDETIAKLDFNEKRAIPFTFGTDVIFETNHVIVAKFVGDTGSPTGSITVIGHEHIA